MGKRKQVAPQHASEAKRQQLQWSMTDQASSTSLSKGACSDHTLQREDINQKESTSLSSSPLSDDGSLSVQTPIDALCIDAFYQNLASCHSTLSLLSKEYANLKIKDRLLQFGSFKVTLTNQHHLIPLPDQLPEFKECFLYLASGDNPHMLYFETEDNNENIIQKKIKSRQSKFGVFWFASLNVPVEVISRLKTKNFWIVCDHFDTHLKELTTTIFGSHEIIMQLSHPSEAIRIKSPQIAVQRLMEFYYDIHYPYNFNGRTKSKAHDFFHLYENVMLIQRERLSEDISWEEEVKKIYHNCLKPVLRPYQKESVAWMLRQERKPLDKSTTQKDIHPLYCEVKFKDSTLLYYNRFSGSFIKQRPDVVPPLPGGILADEMGLGKTVEILCCMLLNPRQGLDQPEPLPVLDDDDVNMEPLENDNADTEMLDQKDANKEHTPETANSESSDPKTANTETSDPKTANTESSDPKDAVKEHVPETADTESSNPSDCDKEQMPETTSTESSNLKDADKEHTPETADSEAPNPNDALKKHINETANTESADQSHTDKEHIPGTADTKSSNSENPGKEHAPAENTERDLPLSKEAASLLEEPSAGKEGVKPVRKKRKNKGTVEYVLVSDDDHKVPTPVSRKQFFECSCGQLENEEETLRKGLHTVKCNHCGMSQHAECMNYDLRDAWRGEYLCPHCHALSSKIKSGATLIISPHTICHQWIDEIKKHIKECSIKVFIYTGVSKLGYIQPQTLARQDIVITTYDVLRKEVDYANLPHTNSESGRRFRHPKRFLATPSPMVAVEWWRICLDEAQMVECVTTKTAEMAMRLNAVNRWCVTGTPLMRSVEDIYGLLLFLGFDPFMVQQWFKSFIWDPFCHGICAPMYHTLAQVFWRTAKKDVVDQIQLPAQSEETYWLTFSPVEEHFYRRQYEIYQRNAHMLRGKTRQWQNSDAKLHSLDRKTMNELLNPLFKLRQACCHPQIVRGAFLPLNKTMMSMEEVLEHMTKKAKTECEEAHRQIVASLNGLAGLAILKRKLPEAVDFYREVLRSVEEHKDIFRTDDLQQLHAMHNLAYVLDQKPEGVAPTLRDGSLREQCEDLKKKYVAKALTNVTAAEEALKLTTNTIGDITLNMNTLDAEDWWADVVEFCIQRGIGEELVDKVKDDMSRNSRIEMINAFRSTDRLLYVIDSHLQALKKARTSLTQDLNLLAKDKSHELVQEAALCCMRPVDKVLETCPFCKVHRLFNEYESKLFMFVERGVTVTGEDGEMAYQVNTKRQGTWADSEVEKALKSILAFYKLNFDTDGDIVRSANLHMKLFDTFKKEFKNLRAVWLGHRGRVSAVDELEMAIERLRFREEYEPKTVTKILNVIEVYQMRYNELKFKSDEIVGRTELRKKQGQLIYLRNLAKQSQEGIDLNPELCPICQSELGVEWSVMLCGHCFCLRCMRTLMDRNLIGLIHQDQRLKCPMCRNAMSIKEIAYVTTKKMDQVQVKGSHSTKVQAVVECLIKIGAKDPTAKSLVFSAWVSILDILGAALSENNIPYRSLHDNYNFQKNLSAFKEDASIQVLLLPLHTGANGLNLVEASNVLLVEPELNLEQEAQAISRICRIGQIRQTKVHRFLVRGTIEEKIHDMVKTLRNSKVDSLGEEKKLELTVGDITSLIEQPCPDEPEEEEDLTAIGNTNEETNFTVPAVGRYQRPPRSESETLENRPQGNVVDTVPPSEGGVSLPNNNMSQNDENETQSPSDAALSLAQGIANATSSTQPPEPSAGPSDQSTVAVPNESDNLRSLHSSGSQNDDSAICDMNAAFYETNSDISLTATSSASQSTSQGDSQSSGETFPSNLENTGLTEEVFLPTDEQISGVPGSLASEEESQSS